jgi:hypothetical protein
MRQNWILRRSLKAPSTENGAEALQAEAIACMRPLGREVKMEILAEKPAS